VAAPVKARIPPIHIGGYNSKPEAVRGFRFFLSTKALAG
jgi:hypothetical protein